MNNVPAKPKASILQPILSKNNVLPDLPRPVNLPPPPTFKNLSNPSNPPIPPLSNIDKNNLSGPMLQDQSQLSPDQIQ